MFHVKHMTSAFYRSLTNKYTDKTQWFPLSNQSLWNMLTFAGVTKTEWVKGYTPMQVLEFATQSSLCTWSDTENYCVFSFYHFMKYCLDNRFIVPRPIGVNGSTVSQPSIRLHMSWCTIFFKIYDV